jgi:ketosteroid isomerase-like protein
MEGYVNSPSKSDIESDIRGIVAGREAWITGAKARDVNGLTDIVTDDVVVVRPWFRNAG